MQKKLSIMLPVYNMELYIDDCLRSLVKQSWEDDVEIIIIDDGSVDASTEICQKYSSKYKYIKLYRKENGGVASARNMALQYASGEYFYWVDPDDYIVDDFWQKISSVLQQGYDFIFFDFVYFSENVQNQKCFGNQSSFIEKKELIKLFADGIKMASHLPTKIIKKSLWEGISFPQGISLCEDYAVLTYIVPKVKSAFYLHESLYNYRQHAGSICHNVSVRDLHIVHQLVKNRYQHFLQKGFDVDILGILFAEYEYLKVIVFKENISENIEKYQGIYKEMLEHLRKNKTILLKCDSFGNKDKFMLYLLFLDMRLALYLLLRGWDVLKQIRKIKKRRFMTAALDKLAIFNKS